MFKLRFSFFKKFPQEEKRITISTLLTITRIVMTPFIVYTMLIEKWNYAFLLFVCAAITDVLDGNLARWRNEKTLLGAWLDPIADKILTLSCFFTLAFQNRPLLAIPFWFVLIILIRELVVVLGVGLLYITRGFMQVQPTITSKITTLIQIIFLAWLFACNFFNWLPIKTYYVIFSIMVGFVILSLLQYVRMGIVLLQRSKV